ncbi:OLC1v1023687C1 [Oldenlandia corymbosa var. corymbosa]|uniref:RING-type E3 ubiquitin transferase n=1 Tax=Oldenlandia corymbosa var. corymbosa TaxID=529605 RepID=A0AAV1C0Z7_OLDCO|nr:OLC1v1023687C1 [Oldenlandia corymbosa var. corymbosa]
MADYAMLVQRQYYAPPSYYPQPVNGGFGNVSHLDRPPHGNYRRPMNQIRRRTQEPSGQLRNIDFLRFNIQIQDETAIISRNNFNTRSYVVDETIMLNGFGSMDEENRVSRNKDMLAGKIWRHLGTRNYQASLNACGQDPGFCVVCQSDFADGEKLGKLECGHEYHADCIHKWLLEKNVCLVCKRTAIAELGR